MNQWPGKMLPAVLILAAIAGCGAPATPQDGQPEEIRMLIFHNGTGPMCLEALSWVETMRAAHPDLVIEEHLTTEPAGLALFRQLESQYGYSQGLSANFGYLPVIFLKGQAFSGFNEAVKAALASLISS